MKSLCLPIVLAAVLSGCVTVPYDDPYPIYSDQVYGQGYYVTPPAYAVTPYPVQPGYVAPPVYGPVYPAPPVQFGFGLNYWSGGGGRGYHGHPHPRLQPHPPRGFRPRWDGPHAGPRR
jgi:hypothetical protein